MMDRKNLAALVALTDLDGIGDKRALELFRSVKTPEELWSSPLTAFEEFYYVDEKTHGQLQKLPDAIDIYRERFDRYDADGIAVIGIDDERYPAALRRHHAPPVLYARGDVELLAAPSVSVSGSRETNEAGRRWTREIANELAEEGYTIVSGGAGGADTAAHEGALGTEGSTVVVLGTGVDRPYPKENAALFSEVIEDGGLVLSHRPPDARPTRHAFLDRNPTISALSTGTVIVATDGSGGTMAQYEVVVEQDRTVFVPAAELGVQPGGGLEELRGCEATTVVSTAAEIGAELERSPPSEANHPENADGDRMDQTSLNEWG